MSLVFASQARFLVFMRNKKNSKFGYEKKSRFLIENCWVRLFIFKSFHSISFLSMKLGNRKLKKNTPPPLFFLLNSHNLNNIEILSKIISAKTKDNK